MRRRLLPEQETVEDARSNHDGEARPEDQRSGHRKAEPRGTIESSQQEPEDLPKPRPREVHGHGQAGREQGPDGVPGEQQARQGSQRARAAQAVDDPHGCEGTREGKGVQQAELEHQDPDRNDDRDSRSEGGARRRPEHIRIRQRISEQALERRAGNRKPEAHHHRLQDARQP